MSTSRLDREGRDVTDTPGLWSEDDVEVCVRTGKWMSSIWCRQCTDGAEWFDTGETHMHRVRSAVRNGEFFE